LAFAAEKFPEVPHAAHDCCAAMPLTDTAATEYVPGPHGVHTVSDARVPADS